MRVLFASRGYFLKDSLKRFLGEDDIIARMATGGNWPRPGYIRLPPPIELTHLLGTLDSDESKQLCTCIQTGLEDENCRYVPRRNICFLRSQGPPYRGLKLENHPVLPFLVFFEIPCFFPYEDFLVFLSVFPFFSRDFRGSEGIKKSLFFWWFFLPLSTKKTRKGRTGQDNNIFGIKKCLP